MTRSRLPRTTTAVAALACLALVAAACGGGSSGSDSAPEDPPTAAGDVDEPTAIDGVATSDAPVVAEAPVSEGQIIEDVVPTRSARFGVARCASRSKPMSMG